MNYYERHIGDWIRDTVSLTMLEEGAYNRLVDQCYQTEKPIPKTKSLAYRLARANNAAERKAVDFVLESFFDLTEAGYVQKRVDQELARYAAKREKAQASANARWKKSDGNANASKPHDASDMRSHSDGNALQSPVTNKEKDIGDAGDTVPRYTRPQDHAADDPLQDRSIAIVKLLRPLGCAIQGSNPHVRKWAEQQIDDVQILTAFTVAKKRRQNADDPQPINPGYVDSILTDVIAEAKRPAAARSQSASARLDEWNRQLSETIAAADPRQPSEIDMGHIDATGQSD